LLIFTRPVHYFTINFTPISSSSSVTCLNYCLYLVTCVVRALVNVRSDAGHTYGMLQLYGLRGIPEFISYKVNNMISIVRPYLELCAVNVTTCCARASTKRGGRNHPFSEPQSITSPKHCSVHRMTGS
jgi:hypothetical protein